MRRRTLRRWLSGFLAAVMMVTLLPVTALAVEKPTSGADYDWVQEKIKEIQKIDPLHPYTVNGPYRIESSDLYQYTLQNTYTDETGHSGTDTIILILPGENASNTVLPNYKNAEDEEIPWMKSRPSRVYFSAGVTGIGNYAFADNPNLQQVIFQNASTLQKIGDSVFYNDDMAAFQDESGSGALNLSNVKEMGIAAFYNCDRLTGVTLSGDLNGGSIPERAFSSCNGLTSITIPDGIRTIGREAFSGCTRAGSINLPDSLVTIGESAFACSIDSPNRQLTQLTIPQNVVTIEKEAFYGYKAMTTVTVESTVLQKPGDAAFGNSALSAYSGPQQMEDGQIIPDAGTVFKTPNNEIAKLFENLVNCYTGPISPLRLIEEESYPATCQRPGRNVYEYTYNGETKRLIEELTQLEPHYIEEKTTTVAASCTDPAYYVKVCDNYFVQDPETRKWVRTEHTHNVPIQVNEPEYDLGEGHNYQVTEIAADGIITDSDGVQVTFTCQHNQHSKERDEAEQVVSFTLQAAAASGTTGAKLSSVQLPAVSKGTLSWVNPDQTLQYDPDAPVQYYDVIFTPNPIEFPYLVDENDVPVIASACDGIQLRVGVKIQRIPLDFSRIYFTNTRNLVNPDGGTMPIEVINAPDGTIIGTPEVLYTPSQGTGSAAAPDLKDPWEGTVSATYHYDAKTYYVDPNTEFANPEYEIQVDESAGTVTITHPYEIVHGSWSAMTAEAIPVTYSGEPQETVRLQAVPAGATITWSYAGDGTGSSTDPITMPGGTNSIDLVPITEAGDYTVTITLHHGSYDPAEETRTVQVHVSKRPIEAPQGKTDLMYNAETQTGVALPEGETRYTLSDNTGENAGEYTATAKITNESFRNYCWKGFAETVPEISIPWEIQRRTVMVPHVSTNRTLEYNGTYQTIISQPGNTMFEYVEDETSIRGEFPNSDKAAFTITEGRGRDADSYQAVATLTDRNYQWVGAAAPDPDTLEIDLGSWTIGRAYITAPQLELEGKIYDGLPYDPPAVSDEALDQVAMKADDEIKFLQYTYNGRPGQPVDAGTYLVQAVYNYPQQNYVLLGNNSVSVTISPAPLQLSAPQNGLTVEYTGSEHTVPAPEIKNYPPAGQQPAPLTYTYTYQPDGGEEGSPQTAEGEMKATAAGTYRITAAISPSCQNYTAEPVQYQFQITSAGQTLTLYQGETPVGEDGVTTPLDQTVTVIGKAQLGDPEITYAVRDGQDIVRVDEKTGEVTPLRVGTATIAVTAGAVEIEGIVSIQGVTVTYEVTVTRGKPILNTGGDQVYTYNGASIPAEGTEEAPGYKRATVSAPHEGAVEPDQELLKYEFYKDEGCSEPFSDDGTTAPSAPGTYWLKITYPEDANYQTVSDVVQVTIREAPVGTITANYEGPYDGIAHRLADMVTGEEHITGAEVWVMRSPTEPEATDPGWSKGLTVQHVEDSTSEGNRYWYKVSASGYATEIGEITVKITPAELTVEGIPNSFTKVYNGNDTIQETVPVTVTGVAGEEISATAAGHYDTKDAGSGKDVTIDLTLSGAEKWSNYRYSETVLTERSLSITLEGAGTISQAPITVTGGVTAQEKVYDGKTEVTLIDSGIKVDGQFNGDDLSVGLSATAQGQTETADVDSGKPVTGITKEDFQLTGDDAKNYEITGVGDSLNVTVNITKRPIQLEWPDDMTFAYKPGGLTEEDYGLRLADGSTFVGDDQLRPNEIQYTFEQGGIPARPVAVGTYTASAELADGVAARLSNYELKLPDPTDLEITSAEAQGLTVEPNVDQLVYNGQQQKLFAGVTVTLRDQTLSKDAYEIQYALTEGGPYSTDIPMQTNAGSYRVYYQVTPENYQTVTGSFTVTITQATLVIGRTLNGTKTYDGGTGLESSQLTGITVSNPVQTETVRVELSQEEPASYDSAAAGDDKQISITYTLTAGDGVDLRNYQVRVTADGSVIPITSQDGTPVNRFDVDETADGYIEKATVTVKPDESSLTKVYGGEDPAMTYQAAGLIGGDTLSGHLSRQTGEDAGTYPVDVGTLTAGENYEVVLAEGPWEFTITPRSIRVQIGGAAGIYGDQPVLTGVELTLEEGSMGFQDQLDTLPGIVLTARTSQEGGEAVTGSTDVGSYFLVGAEENANYEITFDPGTYSVQPRAITITLTDLESTYGENLKPLGYTSRLTTGTGAGIVNNDDQPGGGLIITTGFQSGTVPQDQGIYPITAQYSGEKEKNYTITVVNGMYTIHPAGLKAAFDRQTEYATVGDTLPRPARITNAATGGAVAPGTPGVTIQYTSSDDDIASVDADGTVHAHKLGTVTISVSVTGTGNYTETAAASYELHIAQSGGNTGVAVGGIPNLTYRGQPQKLVTLDNPDGLAVSMTYTVTGPDGTETMFQDQIPTGTDAGEYMVAWEAAYAQDSGYRDQSGTVYVTIHKAMIQNFFVEDAVTVAFAQGTYSGNLSPEAERILQGGFDGTVTFSSEDGAVASFTDPETYQLALNGLGTTTVHAYLSGSSNYENGMDSFTLTVTADANKILVTSNPVHVTYDGGSHGPDIQVANPASGYQIWYQSESGAYDSPTAPEFINAGTYTVDFQVAADGYEPVTGTATVQIDKREITAQMFQDSIASSYTYIGSQIQPPVEVIYAGVALTEGVDYEVRYGENISNSGTVTVTALPESVNFTGKATVSFHISARDANHLSASLDHYFGFAGDTEQDIATSTVKFAGRNLTYGTEYTVEATGGAVRADGSVDFSDAAPGTYTIMITPTVGNFSGTLTLSYTLLTAADGELLADGGVTTGTYGDDSIDGAITVENEQGEIIPASEYDLSYTYYPNDGSPAENGDYAPTVLENAGLYVVKATGKEADAANGITGVYADQSSVFVFLIQPRDLADAEIRVTGDTTYRDGQPVEPAVTVTYQGESVGVENYTLSYGNNIQPGEGYVWVKARGNNYVGAAIQTFTITAPEEPPLDFTLTVGNRQWVYDGNANAGSIIVYSADQQLTIGTDYTLTITRDGQTLLAGGTDTAEAIAAIVDVGQYLVTAHGTGKYSGLTSTVTVTVSPNPTSPTLTVTAQPTALSGGGSTTVTVTVSNPETLANPTLTVQKNGVAYSTLPLTDNGGGRYTAVFQAPNENAVYTFLAAHAGLTASAALTVTATGGSGGDGGDGGRNYIIEAEAGVGGSISPSGRVSVPGGSSRTFRITADEGYAIASVVVDGRGVGHMSSYTFENVREDHTIEVTFRRVTEQGDPAATGVGDWLNTVDHTPFLNGYSNGSFRPDANMTRAQVAQMFYNLLLNKDVPSTASYNDVAPDAWCAEAVRVMSALGVVTGYADGSFRPNEPITRAQFAVIAMRFTDVTAPMGKPFSDVPATAWYYEEVMGAAGFGWLSGYSDGTFRPNNPITRAEVAVITNRMLGRSADEAYINSHLLDIQQFTDLGLPHWAFYDIMEAANTHDYRKENGVEYWL